MKLALQFPHIVYREGPAAVAQVAVAAESIGFDQIDFFDHVVMGHPMEGRLPGPYPTEMPILEPLVSLGFAAAVTKRIGLGIEVLVLPQRQPALNASLVYIAGSQNADCLCADLERIHDRIRAEVGHD